MRYLFLLFLMCFNISYAGKDYIPPKAFEYKQVILNEINAYFEDIPELNYIPALIEHESCLSLTHSKCWSSMSQLKTSREQGVGLGQITRAYHKDGSIRFDALSEMRKRYVRELKDADWETIRYKPDLQIRMIVLMSRDLYHAFYNIDDRLERLKMTDSAYNGGKRDVDKARKICGLSSNCNSKIWFDNVERFSVKSKKILYGDRSARDINNHHVRDVFLYRLPKYKRGYYAAG